ncbi:hypothetical protein ACFQXB_05925 [Plastorhodobacter daqingensis]|uniref:DUF4175 domain-containing protein n=1 Tax=Plastorhodobacter daqingensis TaxID=1387281 RepID=A0ABW2UIB9_9RHOB
MSLRSPDSLGEKISSAAFLGMALWLGLEALGAGPGLRGIALGLSALMCLAGAFRFALGRLLRRLRRARKPRRGG